MDTIEPEIENATNKMYKNHSNAIKEMLVQGYVVIAILSHDEGQVLNYEIIGYPKDKFDTLAKDIGNTNAFKTIYAAQPKSSNLQPLFIYELPTNTGKNIMHDRYILGAIPAFNETKAQITHSPLFTAQKARLQATGIKIGSKTWDFTEAITNPPEKLMLEFSELGNILLTIASTARAGKRSYTQTKLTDVRLQQVLEACLKKLGYNLNPILERSTEDDAPEYFQISW